MIQPGVPISQRVRKGAPAGLAKQAQRQKLVKASPSQPKPISRIAPNPSNKRSSSQVNSNSYPEPKDNVSDEVSEVMNLPDFKKKPGIRDLNTPKPPIFEEKKVKTRQNSQDIRRPDSAPKSPYKAPEPHIGTAYFEPEQVKFLLNQKPMDPVVVDLMSTEPGGFTSRSANEAEDLDEPLYEEEEVAIPTTEVVVGISSFIEQPIPRSDPLWHNHTVETLATVDWELSTTRQYREDYIIPTAETVTPETYRINYTTRTYNDDEVSDESDEQPYDFSENSLEDQRFEHLEDEDEYQEPIDHRPQTREELVKKQSDILMKIDEFSKLIECRRTEIISKLGQDFFNQFYAMCKSAVTVIYI